MTGGMIKNLSYPKPNVDDLHRIYEFEIGLLEEVTNGQENNALKLYDDFFSNKYIYTIAESDSLQHIKNYLISISLLICHSIIKKGVFPYSAMAKYHAICKLIQKSSSKSDTLNIGRIIIRGYSKQVSNSINTIENISIRKAIHYIHNNLGEELTLDMIARHANLSKCYFCTQFKKEMKMNFTDYLTYTRIEKSKYLLCNSDKSILDIAILIGFNSQGYFTTQFKKHTGITPKEFRDRNDDRNYIF